VRLVELFPPTANVTTRGGGMASDRAGQCATARDHQNASLLDSPAWETRIPNGEPPYTRVTMEPGSALLLGEWLVEAVVIRGPEFRPWPCAEGHACPRQVCHYDPHPYRDRQFPDPFSRFHNGSVYRSLLTVSVYEQRTSHPLASERYRGKWHGMCCGRRTIVRPGLSRSLLTGANSVRDRS